jgi:hypothetical protein
VEPIRVQGRTLTGDDLRELRALIAQHPDWHRTALSLHLCQLWHWRNGAGQIKDMAARTLLLKLAARGLIELPPPQRRTRRPCAQAPPMVQEPLRALSPEPMQERLASLRPIRLELADTRPKRQQVRQWLAQYHYRGFHGAVGENVQYLAKDRHGRELAVMVFGAAAWKVAVRDRFINWSVPQRAEGLGAIANQQRFLILPWVRVPHLASHLLVLAARRLAGDWQNRYGHRVWLIESFVEQARFTGISYQAAGWIYLGQTTGRTRQDRQRTLQSPVKALWVRPLHPDFRKHLSLR